MLLRNLYKGSSFLLFLLFNFVNCSAATNVNCKVPIEFLQTVHRIGTNPEVLRLAKRERCNYLIAPMGLPDEANTRNQPVNLFLSGIRPIMSTEQKERLSGRLQLTISLLDIFDVILNVEAANHVRDVMLNYIAASSAVKYVDFLSNQKIRELVKAEIVDYKEDIKRFFGKVPQIDRLTTALVILSSSSDTNIENNIAKVKEAYSSLKANIEIQLKQIQTDAYHTTQQYMDSLEKYHNTMEMYRSTPTPNSSASAVSGQQVVQPPALPAGGVAALAKTSFFANIAGKINVQNSMDSLIANIIDPNSLEGKKFKSIIGPEIYSVVELTHTEPMYVFFLNPKQLQNRSPFQYFFTLRDMCNSCRGIINKAVNNEHSIYTFPIYSTFRARF